MVDDVVEVDAAKPGVCISSTDVATQVSRTEDTTDTFHVCIISTDVVTRVSMAEQKPKVVVDGTVGAVKPTGVLFDVDDAKSVSQIAAALEPGRNDAGVARYVVDPGVCAVR